MVSGHILIVLILYIIILRMIPGFDDHIGLREELRYCIWCFIAMVSVWLLFILFMAATSTIIKNDGVWDLLTALTWLVYRVFIFLFNMKQTRWPLKRFESIVHQFSERKLRVIA